MRVSVYLGAARHHGWPARKTVATPRINQLGPRPMRNEAEVWAAKWDAPIAVALLAIPTRALLFTEKRPSLAWPALWGSACSSAQWSPVLGRHHLGSQTGTASQGLCRWHAHEYDRAAGVRGQRFAVGGNGSSPGGGGGEGFAGGAGAPGMVVSWYGPSTPLQLGFKGTGPLPLMDRLLKRSRG